MKNLLLKLVCFLLLGLFYPSEVFAFIDEFNSQSSLDNYNVSTNSGSVVVESGKLIISAPNSAKHFPYVALKNQHIGEQVESISIDFRYSNIGVFGAGIIIDDNYPVNGNNYDVGSNSIVWTWNWGAPPKLRLGRYPFIHSEIFDQTGVHNLKITGIPGMYEILLDDIFQGTTISSKQIDSLWFGNPDIVSTTSSWPVIEIERIQINNTVAAPSFPYFSQRDPAWRDLPYDNASVWAGAEANSIERWGCAITSVAMVLEEYDIKMPNGDVVNPDKLNTWLSTQPDGYIGNGLLNWLAISRLARVSRAAGNSPTDLEFVKSYGSAVDEIESGEYPIVNEGGHFITLFDHDETNYMIYDPLDESRKTKAKTDLLVSVNTYTPSDTDLSYLMIVGEPNTELELLLSGASVGSSYTESIHDDVGGSATTRAKVVMLPKPSDGSYRLNVNNPDSAGSQFKVYAYNTLGEVHILDQSAPSGDSSWNLVYESNGSDPLITPLDTTPPEYVSTNTFSGWYKTAQTATFMFSDPNLPMDFVPPTCVISREGKNQTCTITTQVCDSLNNCKSYTLKSNPANIDLTPPKVPKHVWGHGLWPMSLIYWSEVSDATEYRIEWGKSPTQLTNSLKTKHQHVWIATNKYQKLYVRVIAIDRAGNESVGSKKMEIPVWRGHWRFW